MYSSRLRSRRVEFKTSVEDRASLKTSRCISRRHFQKILSPEDPKTTQTSSHRDVLKFKSGRGQETLQNLELSSIQDFKTSRLRDLEFKTRLKSLKAASSSSRSVLAYHRRLAGTLHFVLFRLKLQAAGILNSTQVQERLKTFQDGKRSRLQDLRISSLQNLKPSLKSASSPQDASRQDPQALKISSIPQDIKTQNRHPNYKTARRPSRRAPEP